jgi:hypothetical protein
MQTDQMLWLAAGGIAVLILLFSIRLFRMPQDERLSSVAERRGLCIVRGHGLSLSFLRRYFCLASRQDQHSPLTLTLETCPALSSLA